jgi:hypothetical protein
MELYILYPFLHIHYIGFIFVIYIILIINIIISYSNSISRFNYFFKKNLPCYISIYFI